MISEFVIAPQNEKEILKDNYFRKNIYEKHKIYNTNDKSIFACDIEYFMSHFEELHILLGTEFEVNNYLPIKK